MQAKQKIEVEIKNLIRDWSTLIPSIDKIRYAGPNLDADDYEAIMDGVFSEWVSGGRHTLNAEQDLSKFSNRKFALTCNSGSSANLLLMSAAKELWFKDGDKILTLSTSFPTTVNPIIQNRLIPVFCDIDLNDLNINPNLLSKILSKDKGIKAVFVAQTLGFPSSLYLISQLCEQYGVKFFSDCCDAYGSKHNGNPVQKYGEAATFSFFVSHEITSAGEGGAIVTDNKDLFQVMRSMRNWGKYCQSSQCCIRACDPELFCPTAKLTENNLLPDDYDVNYTFEFIGMNLKMLDLQAACLSSQLTKIEEFSNIRRKNYRRLYEIFDKSPFNFHLWPINNNISPFSFPFIIPKTASFTRKDMALHYKKNNVETRLLFAGDIRLHPAYQKHKDYWESYQEEHRNARLITEQLLMLGVAPVITPDKLDRLCEITQDFFNNYAW